MKKLKFFLSVMIVLSMTMSCSKENDPVSTLEDAKPIALRVELQKRVAQDNEFALDIFKKTIENSKESNVFLSPLSISIALGMAWNGASGETKTEMATALKMSGMSVSDINDYYKVMQTTLPTIDPTTKLTIANSLWYRTGFPVKNDFLKVNVDYFNAEVRELDFGQAWAVDTINNWCSRKTNKLIPTVLDEIPDDAVMYLINAVYFKGMWRNKFEKKNTVEANFTDEEGTLAKVNMMYQKDTFPYTADAYAHYLDMPYGNKAFSMTVILPAENKTISDVLNYLTVEKWNTTLQNMSANEVEVYFPRFKTSNKYSLNDVLQNMGMKLAFNETADFSSIADTDIFISKVLHDTYVEVTEEGTEAAAVTVVEVVNTSIPEIIQFRVNKPFLFAIREKSTGVILFIGKMGSVEKF